MFGKHVSNLSSAYCQDELAPKESRRFAEHLIACTRCRLEFEEVKLGVRFAEQLSLVSAPDSVWRGVLANLDKSPDKSALSFGRYAFLKPLAIAATIAVLIVGGLLFVRALKRDSRPSWQVARLDGAPRVGSTSIEDRGQLAVGQWLETDGASRAKLDVSNIGQVEIDPNTRVRLIETKPTEHRLELARGRLSARISAPPKLFFVNTPSGVAEDLGCAYTLEVDDSGNSLLRVTFGWVALQLKDRESVVPAGAACVTRPGIGPGTPYFEDASELFRTALAKLDFEPNDTQWSKIPALDIVLHDARPRDAMTLFYLMTRANEKDRARIYDRMATLVAPPDGVTREGMLSFNPQMMELWKQRLSLTWGAPFLTAQRNAASTLVPLELNYSRDFVQKLNESGLTVQNVFPSKLNGLFKETTRAVFLQMGKGVLEVVFFDTSAEVDQIQINEENSGIPNYHKYTIKSARTTARMAGAGTYFIKYRNMLVFTSDRDLNDKLSKLLASGALP